MEFLRAAGIFLLQLSTGFTTQIAIGTLLFCWNKKRRGHYWLRLLVFLPFCAVPYIFRTATQTSFYQLPVFFIGWFAYIFLALVLLCSLLIRFCFDIPYLQILYYCAAAHVLQNLSYMGESIFRQTVFSGASELVFDGVSLCLTALVWLFAYRVLIRRIAAERVDVENKLLAGFAVMATLIINIFHYWTYVFGYLNLSTLIYEAICCVLLLIIQFQIFDRSKQRMEREVMARIYHTADRQQQLARENIGIINRKCHDLKHQLTRLRSGEGGGTQDAFLQELAGAVGIYDSIAKTGNEVLDTILTEKSLLCESRKIDLAVIADGTKLDFMEASDLYSLFGNALDNAIECVSGEDEKNRVISLNIAERGGMVSITLDNYCSTVLQFKNGLPQTTKVDTGYHGLGTQSIKFIVNKYHGSLSMRQDLEGNRFVLSIVFAQIV